MAEIQKVDLANKRVTTARSLDGARAVLEYDQLVVCLGSVDRTEAYPGLAEHAYRLKTYEDCLRLRNHMIEMFELADIEKDPEERRRLLTFFIAGGGYAGTEVAGELSDLARRLTKQGVPAASSARSAASCSCTRGPRSCPSSTARTGPARRRTPSSWSSG